MRAIGLTVGLVSLLCAGGVARADVFNMGGTRNPLTGQWTGLASLEFVTVGDPGNATDVTGYGAVPYTFQIGKFDVTTAQYCQFLNAVASRSDPFGLYDEGMRWEFPSGGACGITRTGSPGNYFYVFTYTGYTVNNGNFPANLVDWGSAARFCNWLTNGQPTGPEGAGTTETGSYTLNGAFQFRDSNLILVARNANARYVIPTEDEWYKAAYYRGGSTNAGYWLYPTRSDSPPSNVLDPNGTNNANYYADGYTDPVNSLTQVGAFAASPGPYGTYDMGGLVLQWNEAASYGLYRGLRGGTLYNGYADMQSSHSDCDFPTSGGAVGAGFRIAEVPEPATLCLLVLGGLAMIRRRRT